MKKDLFIINGCSGAVGNACLAILARNPKNVVYGISRKANHFTRFGKILPEKTIVFSIGDDISDQKALVDFKKAIQKNVFSSINYIHAVGYYPFELDQKGEIKVENDLNGDGINDKCTRLTFEAFTKTCEILKNDCQFKALIFGSLADKFEPEVHQSWWKSMKKVREYMENNVTKNISMNILNISSVVCFHELQTRPFVFTNTDGNASFWLTPQEVAEKVDLILSTALGFSEQDFFNPAPYYQEDYFSNEKFTPRKKLELGL